MYLVIAVIGTLCVPVGSEARFWYVGQVGIGILHVGFHWYHTVPLEGLLD